MKKNSKFKIQNSKFKYGAVGFTLIELLVVIVIISVLASILITNFVGVRQRARDSQRKADLRQVQVALEMFRSDYGYYPTVLPSCETVPLSRLSPTPVLLASAKLIAQISCNGDPDCPPMECNAERCLLHTCRYFPVGNGTPCTGGTCQDGTCVPNPTSPPTSAPTSPPTSAPTSPPTSAPTSPPTSAPTSPPTSAPTSPPTSTPTPTTAPYIPAGDTVYIQEIPCDPNGSGYYNLGNYYYSSDGLTYFIVACLENSNDPQGEAGPQPGGTCTSNHYYVLQNP